LKSANLRWFLSLQKTPRGRLSAFFCFPPFLRAFVPSRPEPESLRFEVSKKGCDRNRYGPSHCLELYHKTL
jgi:hypothetical protein